MHTHLDRGRARRHFSLLLLLKHLWTVLWAPLLLPPPARLVRELLLLKAVVRVDADGYLAPLCGG